MSDHGCERCWPEAADAAWGARARLTHAEVLIDESHYRVTLLACPACGQRFLSVFTETVDWADSEDPQYWTLLPLEDAEAADLIRRGAATSEADLGALGAGRRSLMRDFPKGVPEPTVYWATGVRIGRHD